MPEINAYNKILTSKTNIQKRAYPKKAKDLGKEEFLKLLVKQLEHQDPLQPMEDREFIAQLAQFSALEQMMNMNKSMGELKKFTMIERMNSLLGKKVRIYDFKNEKEIVGIVDEIVINLDEPKIKVNNKLYNLENVVSILNNIEKISNSDNQIRKTNLTGKE